MKKKKALSIVFALILALVYGSGCAGRDPVEESGEQTGTVAIVDRGEFPDKYDMDFEYAGDNRNVVIPGDERESGLPSLGNLNDPEYITLVADKVNEVDLGDMLQIIVKENHTTEYRWYFDIFGDNIMEVVSDDYNWDPNPGGADGADGTRTITFLSVAPGEATVEMALMQEMPEPPENLKNGLVSQTVNYLITVKK